uniref:Uncharacterized protein n=1 Tax=Glossina morsitans morsitans TaxID=37546 RepID=A0A1B0FP30_GLOMM
MGRCQSTPGLVESCGRTTLEDMYVPPPSVPLVPHSMQQLSRRECQLHQQTQSLAYSRAPSPRTSQTYTERIIRTVEAPGSMSPSVHSSDDRPRSRASSHHSTRPQSQPSRTGSLILLSIPSVVSICRRKSLLLTFYWRSRDVVEIAVQKKGDQIVN